MDGMGSMILVVICVSNRMKVVRGHDQKLFKRRYRLDIRKFAFSNRVMGYGGSINCFKKYISTELESGAVQCIRCYVR